MQFEKIKQKLAANLLIISILLIVGGFLVMSIDDSTTNGGKSFHQLTIAPILLLLGYSLVIFAIMNPGRKDKVDN